MIQPNMATLHGFILTNAKIPATKLRSWIKDIANNSFNRITVDSDASTNDTLLLMASGKGPVIPPLHESEFKDTLKDVAIDLAQQIVKDGEGCTKFVTFTIDHASNENEARSLFFAICNSPLVKTAWFGENPNFGRILCSAGKIESSLVPEKVDLWMGPHLFVEQGTVVPLNKDILDAYMKNKDLEFRLDLHLGRARFTGWTTDLSYEYVKINAEYN
jgi:glutamate N-acetyltransferase/amino-acid N-acetyltransferase